MVAKTNFQDFNAKLKKKYIELLKQEGYVFSEVVLKEMFTKEEIQSLLLTNFIEPIYKGIYVATTASKTKQSLWNSKHKFELLWELWNELFKNYYYGKFVSLAYYIKKSHSLSLEDIELYNLKRWRGLKISDIGDIKCLIDRSWDIEKFQTKILTKGKTINILTPEYLLKTLFEKKVQWKSREVDFHDIVNFLELMQFNIVNFEKIVNKNTYVYNNISKFLFEHQIFNQSLIPFLQARWITFPTDFMLRFEKGKEIVPTQTSWSVIRMRHAIDNIIQTAKNIELDMENSGLQLPTFSNEIIKNEIIAEETKDIYHSTTIEGYEISPDEVDFIHNGVFPNWIKSKEEQDEYISKLKNVDIIKSYKRAFEMIMEEYLWKPKQLTKDDLVKINYYEFIEWYVKNNKPLNEHNYRNHIVRMNKCEWFLPVESIAEIDELVDYLLNKIETLNNNFIKWIALHFLLVPIQPFWDGNGRLSRFLMNIIFSWGWYKWITITDHAYRLKFLSSYGLVETGELEKLSQVFEKFVEFISSYLPEKIAIEKKHKKDI